MAAIEKNKAFYYSPSINIVRDQKSLLKYIITYNTQLVFNQVNNAILDGVRSFTIVGAYGTGKSAFLWALEKQLNQEEKFFSSIKDFLPSCNAFEFIDFIGDYHSLIESFDEKFQGSDLLITKIKNNATAIKGEGKGLIIRIDEFGKFLEYAAKNNPEKELYFLQQLAELVNDKEQNIILFTILHQDFSAYAYELSKPQRHEWEKVKGRYKEITFNEPVENLLFLASERLAEEKYEFSILEQKELLSAIEKAQIFPLKDYFNLEVATKLLPIDILAASTLTLALQAYGQNQRSLFSFVESNDYLGVKDFIKAPNAPLYNLVSIYDYLNQHFHSFLSTKYNPHYNQWSVIKSSIERAEGVLKENISEACMLIKAIGILAIFSKKSAKIDRGFLSKYAGIALGIKNCPEVLYDLERHKIIRFVEFQSRFNLFEGTDIDIELAIDEAGHLVEQVKDISKYLNEYIEFSYVPAKAYHYEFGTPRYFEFKLTEEPILEIPIGEIDGYINLIFSDDITEQALQLHSTKCDEAILFVLFKNASQIKQLVHEIEKVKKAIQENSDDKIAVREFKNIQSHQQSLLNHYVLDKLYAPDENVCYFFRGEKQPIKDKRSFNQLLSRICKEVYSATPVFLNEMINKTKLSSQISTARKSLIKKLIYAEQIENLEYTDQQFPPDKTIYLSLLKETGIHRIVDEKLGLHKPTNEGFQALWLLSEEFIDDCKHAKRSLSEFVDRLSTKPIKLKRGFVDFWIPIYLLIKKDDFALFGKEGYIPFLTDSTLELVVKKPQDFEIKAFDVEGVKLEVFNKYRELISQSTTTSPNNTSFIETIKPFLSFYRGLPSYSKNTSSISKNAQRLREAIAKAKEPEKVFFEEFPQALGYTLEELNKDPQKLEAYFNQLRDAIKQIRTSYDQLLERFEAFILEEIIGQEVSFDEWKTLLTERFQGLKQYALITHQKVFFQRINSPLDSKSSWLNSVAQAVLKKPLEQIEDDEEFRLYDQFKDLVNELDNLIDISKSKVYPEEENIIKLEITSFLEGAQKKFIRLPKSSEAKAAELEKKLKGSLAVDKNLNIYILTQLLKEQLKDE